MIVSPQERKDLIKKTYTLKFIKEGSGYKVCKDKILLGLFLSKITVNDTLKKGDYKGYAIEVYKFTSYIPYLFAIVDKVNSVPICHCIPLIKDNEISLYSLIDYMHPSGRRVVKASIKLPEVKVQESIHIDDSNSAKELVELQKIKNKNDRELMISTNKSPVDVNYNPGFRDCGVDHMRFDCIQSLTQIKKDILKSKLGQRISNNISTIDLMVLKGIGCKNSTSVLTNEGETITTVDIDDTICLAVKDLSNDDILLLPLMSIPDSQVKKELICILGLRPITKLNVKRIKVKDSNIDMKKELPGVLSELSSFD